MRAYAFTQVSMSVRTEGFEETSMLTAESILIRTKLFTFLIMHYAQVSRGRQSGPLEPKPLVVWPNPNSNLNYERVRTSTKFLSLVVMFTRQLWVTMSHLMPLAQSESWLQGSGLIGLNPK